MFPILGFAALALLVVFGVRKNVTTAVLSVDTKDPSAGYAVVDPSRVSKSAARPTLEQLATLGPGSLVDAFMARSTALGDLTAVIVGRLRIARVEPALPPRIVAAFDSITDTSPISFVAGSPTPKPGTIFVMLPTDVFFVVPKTEVSI